MKTNLLGRIRGLKPDLIPPRDAENTGQVHTDGRIIYKRKELDRDWMKKNKVQAKAPDGSPLFRKNVDDAQYPVMRTKPKYVEREFVLDRSPQGHVRLQYHFREDPQELERQAFEARKDDVLDGIASRIASADDASVARFLSMLDSDDEPEGEVGAEEAE